MITEDEKETILRCAKKFDIDGIYIFGSSIEKEQGAHDIDIGVKGLKDEKFFRFYADLFKALTKPVDLIDLSKKSLFTEMIEKYGLKIYDRSI